MHGSRFRLNLLEGGRYRLDCVSWHTPASYSFACINSCIFDLIAIAVQVALTPLAIVSISDHKYTYTHVYFRMLDGSIDRGALDLLNIATKIYVYIKK